MKNNEYLKLVKSSQKKKIKITKEQQRHIRKLYRELSLELEKELSKVNPESLTSKWLYEYRKSIEREINRITKEIYKTTKQKMVESINVANDPQLSFFNAVSKKYGLELDKAFSSMFSKVNTNVINEILSGKIYKDNKGLSKRIWMDSKHINNDIQKIIVNGIASKKSTYELAKDLQKYINPDERKDWEWSKVYPGSRKKIDYNAQRLARTSIQHAYQMAQVRSCANNPFIDGIEWNSVFSHRTCDLCKERDGVVFSVENLPLDHP